MQRARNVAVVTALAIRLGISTARLRVAMEEVGRSAGEPPTGGPAVDLARQLGVPTRRVRAAMAAAVSGTAQVPHGRLPAGATTLLASSPATKEHDPCRTKAPSPPAVLV